MASFVPLRDLAIKADYGPNDVMVVFGELFSRGYANGIVDEAVKKGMKVIYSTVGRRDDQDQLRPLNADELAQKSQPLINVPLEAGFDLEPAKNGQRPVDQLQGFKLSEWDQIRLDWKAIEESRLAGVERFRQSTKQFLEQVDKIIPDTANVLFVHTMAGGFPRAKIVMPAANRVFKGFGERYTSSETFWNTDIGRLCDLSFKEVTGETLLHLLDLSAPIRRRLEGQGRRVSYVAYGYHGTEVMMNGEYRWQSYSPYLQGWAKIRLEEIAEEAFAKGIKACVFNAPEILTNSSSIFLGVEVSLYPLLAALRKEGQGQLDSILKHCESLLKPPHSIDEVLEYTDRYLKNSVIREWSQFDLWPQHNGPEQMELMRTSSSELIAMHKDEKQLMTAELSELVFKACGTVMFNEAWAPRQPVAWMGHDLVAKVTANIL